ncbi:carboxypeptidase regulatory-like domain-containing protein [Haloarchaeobius sp. TZWSO28]|uniref:carboxypeptidase regulatory-like domain-containing protein n=1 Tax=unclassified Haloarchaeobius TaxID=2614452 RepID=UPI003EC04019
MRLIAIGIGLLLLLAPVTGVAAADGSTPDVALRITVVTQNGDGVGNAEVTVTYDGESQTRETVSNGEVLFDVPKGADVKIDVEHPFLVRNNAATVTDVSDGDEVSVTMYETASASFTVEDGDGPVANANVKVRKANQLPAATGTTGSDGGFETGEIEKGEYTVTITKPGYFDEETTLTISGSTTETFDLEQGSANVQFSVVDSHFEDPKPLEATIAIDGVGSFQTDKNGNRGVTLDVNTEYTVSVSKDGYDGQSGTLTVGETDKQLTYEISRTPELTLEPANTQVVVGQTVRVTVTDEYGEAVEGATVRVGGTEAATTGADGGATVEIASAGDVELEAVNGSVTSDSVTVEGVQAATDAPEQTTTTEMTEQTTTEQATTTAGESGDGSTPGFGVGAAVAALLGSLLVLQRRSA